jgi:hypothetical protein
MKTKYKHLLVLGSSKCGTSTLHMIADEHPEIAMAKGKEINYFIEHEGKLDYLDYLSNFVVDDKTIVIGEASPRYVSGETPESAFTGMVEFLPECLYVYMVRDPMERISSMYFHELRGGKISGSLLDAVESSDVFLKGSDYPYYLKLLEESHGVKPYIIEFNEFIESPRDAVRKLVSELRLCPSKIKDFGDDHFNIGYKVGIDYKKNPIRYKLLHLSRSFIKPYKRKIPLRIREFTKRVIAGRDGIKREGDEIREQELILWQKHKSQFLKTQRVMKDKYGVNCNHWYARFK